MYHLHHPTDVAWRRHDNPSPAIHGETDKTIMFSKNDGTEIFLWTRSKRIANFSPDQM